MAERRHADRETLDSRLDEIAVDSADLHGNVGKVSQDRSLARDMYEGDEDPGPGGYSGVADNPYLGGSTGLADDVGLHIDPGFSVGYDTTDETDIGPDEGNDQTYLSLGDAAEGREKSRADEGTGLQTALGVPDVGDLPLDSDDLSIDRVSGGAPGYGAMGTDSDTDLSENAS